MIVRNEKEFELLNNKWMKGLFLNLDRITFSKTIKGNSSLTGFTLIEIMISLSIISVIVVAVYSTYRVCISTYEREKSRGYLYQDVKIVSEYLERDIRSSFVTLTNKKLVFIGKRIQNKGVDTDSLEITTCSSFGAVKNLSSFPLKRVKYLLVNDGKDSDLGLRRAVSYPDLKEEYSWATIGPLIRGLRFKYYDGTSWNDSWETGDKINKPSRHDLILPKAVEVTLTFEDLDNPSRHLIISKVIPVMSDSLMFR